jgi:hypothetical protein
MAKTFQINENASIICEWKKTRMAFKHTAILKVHGVCFDETKICYQNRTWERFEFESVIEKLLDKTNYLLPDERKAFMDKCRGIANEESDKMFNNISAIAKMGEIFCNTDKEKNDWKLRMIKAGLEGQGLIIPDDWHALDETTKTARLDAVINHLAK